MRHFTKDQKTRVISFLIITAILAIYLNAINIATIFSDPLFAQTEGLYIDGADFTAIANVGSTILNFIIQLIVDIITNFILSLVALVLLIPWRVICITKDTELTDEEYSVFKITTISFLTINLVVGIICALASPTMTLLSVASETFIMMIIYLILVILPTRKAHTHADSGSDYTIIS